MGEPVTHKRKTISSEPARIFGGCRTDITRLSSGPSRLEVIPFAPPHVKRRLIGGKALEGGETQKPDRGRDWPAMRHVPVIAADKSE